MAGEPLQCCTAGECKGMIQWAGPQGMPFKSKARCLTNAHHDDQHTYQHCAPHDSAQLLAQFCRMQSALVATMTSSIYDCLCCDSSGQQLAVHSSRLALNLWP